MASSSPLIFALPLVLLISLAFLASAKTEDSTFQIAGDTLNQHETEGVLFYDEELTEEMEEEIIHGASNRRSLFWGRVMRYYISYGAWRTGSGRSYYTHNCYRARGPVHRTLEVAPPSPAAEETIYPGCNSLTMDVRKVLSAVVALEACLIKLHASVCKETKSPSANGPTFDYFPVTTLVAGQSASEPFSCMPISRKMKT